MLLVGIERRAHAETSLNAIKMNMNDTLKGSGKSQKNTHKNNDRQNENILFVDIPIYWQAIDLRAAEHTTKNSARK